MIDPAEVAPLAKRRRSRSRRVVAQTQPVGDQSLWLPIGPTVMTNGQAGGDPNVAGRIVDLAIEPGTGERIYAASAGGGTWISTNRGQTWSPLDDFQLSDLSDVETVSSALSCGALHVIWGTRADGGDDVIWVGTGEPSLTSGGLIPAVLAGGGSTGGLPGGNLLGVGLLNRDPGVASGAWQVVKGDAPGADPDTLRGAGFFRIVADPGNKQQLVAATTNGLYTKPDGGSWTRLPAWVNGFGTQPMDVVLTRKDPTTLRIWVATASVLKVAELTGAHAAPIDTSTLSFSAVGLPGVATNPTPRIADQTVGGTRLALATDGAKVFVLGRRTPSGDRVDPPAALWTVDAAGDLASLAGKQLSGTPDDLFMSAGDQSDYDMCIEADPTVAGRVFVGGATVGTSTGWNGAVYRCDTTATAANPTYVGEGVHADIHVLRVGPPDPTNAAGHTVWIGCDGGLFRSIAQGDPGTFGNRNDGLAVLQPGYVACHPTNPGIVVAGFQDNGTAIREGDGIWRQSFQGDGGGVIFDPGRGRYFRQYTHADWNSSDGNSNQPVLRRGLSGKGQLKSSEGVESAAALFYSGADAAVHGGDTHLVVGSDRVWYSRDWGDTWVTLPSATDPRASRNVDLAVDVLQPKAGPDYNDPRNSLDCCGSTHSGTIGPGLLTVKLSAAPDDPGGNLVLRVVALHATGITWLVGSRPAGGTGPFTWTALASTPRQQVRDPLSSSEEGLLGAGSPLSFLPATDIVSDLCVHDPTRGPLGSLYVTTSGRVLNRSGSTFARDTLWFFDGKDTWRPTGLRAPIHDTTWAVEADRVTSPALGVLVDPDHRETVYVATGVGVVKGTLSIGGTAAAPTYGWVWERFMNGLPTAAVQDLSLFSSGGVRLLRAATQSRGVWEADLAQPSTTPRTYLRLFATDTRRVLPTPTGGIVLDGDPHNPTYWDDSPDLLVDTSGTIRTSPPTEVEIARLQPQGRATERARLSTTERHLQVHVLVHHRWSENLPKDKVKVALLRHDLPDDGVVPIGQLWPGLLAVAAPGTAEPATLQDGWTKAAATLWQSPVEDVDTRVPRAVTFQVDLTGTTPGTSLVFLAVVMSEPDQISLVDLALGGGNAAQTGDQLVVASPHAAACSLEVD